ncbi:2-iminoacetate synthase ThiH [Acetoanaerobium sticklandii]|uniref:2-iminoacetate synthase ThiH n=1 Tax=Acetoanaerobium sticklandii TaxID=1511 RepID=UPI003A8FB8FD
MYCDNGYFSNMEVLNSNIQNLVLQELDSFYRIEYTELDVDKVLKKDYIDFKILLSSAAEKKIEEIALRTQIITRKYFGNNIKLFTPLYISNYCENHCIYCGFNVNNKIKRLKLNLEEIEKELYEISKTGLEEILILTGESIKEANLSYIADACLLAKKYFKTVGIEVYPMNSKEYKYLHKCGVDYVTVFQETYNLEKYRHVHLKGQKKVFSYRFDSQERALLGGMRGVSFGSLLGLCDFRLDAYATGLHAFYIQRKYPHAEISLSCPRLRPVKNIILNETESISDKHLLQVICAYRLFLPYANITVSTRENAKTRDGIMNIAATKLSAGVSTGIGEHSKQENEKGDSQFDIDDIRTVSEVMESIRNIELQPVLNDHVFL